MRNDKLQRLPERWLSSFWCGSCLRLLRSTVPQKICGACDFLVSICRRRKHSAQDSGAASYKPADLSPLSPVRELQFAGAGNRPALLRNETSVIFLWVVWSVSQDAVRLRTRSHSWVLRIRDTSRSNSVWASGWRSDYRGGRSGRLGENNRARQRVQKRGRLRVWPAWGPLAWRRLRHC